MAHRIDFVALVRNRFAIPIQGDIRSRVLGSTVEDGNVEVFPMTDENGRGQVGQRCWSQQSPRGRPNLFRKRSQHDASDDDPSQLWHGPEVGVDPISTKGAHLKVR